MDLTLVLSLSLIGYLMGSLCTAIYICKLFHLPDPRANGSSNPGTTNVMRLGGKFPALLTLLGDGFKGAAPAMASALLGLNAVGIQIVILSAILGHIFPVFFKFKGGKAVATTIGGLLAFNYQIALGYVSSWILIVLLTRISSLGALVAALTLPGMGYYFYGMSVEVVPLTMITIVLFYTHRANIVRIATGTEPRMGKKTDK